MDRTKRLTLLFTVGLAGVGCVAEPGWLVDCPEFRLEFRYEFSANEPEPEPGLPPVPAPASAGDVHLYIFERTSGVLASELESSTGDIERGGIDVDELPDGEYTIVAWGGSSEDLHGSFSHIHLHDAANHHHSDTRVGVTTLDDFYMMLDHCEHSEVEGRFIPQVEEFDDLFHACIDSIVVPRRDMTPVPLQFVRNTNLLKITVKGLNNLDAARGTTRAPTVGQRLGVYATAKNSRYGWRNNIDDDARTLHYEPSRHTLTDTTTLIDIKTLRFDLGRHLASPVPEVVLHIRDEVTGVDLIPGLDVIGSIMQTRSTRTGNLLYTSQDDIDRQYEFPIEVSIEPGTGGKPIEVTIKICGWQIIVLTPELESFGT